MYYFAKLPEDFSFFSLFLTVAFTTVAVLVARRVVSLALVRAIPHSKFPNERERLQRIHTLEAVFISITTGLLGVIGFVVLLVQLGVDLVALATGIGALGVVIGLAGQSLFREVYKGVGILLFDQMRVGDIVEIAGKSGTVDSISLFITRLRDLDGVQHVVPNGEITVVTNMSHNFANVNFDIRVDYDTDINKAEKIMNKLGQELAEHQDFKEKFIEPIAFLRVDTLDDIGINLKALGKVGPGEQWSMAAEYRRRLLVLFHEAGIKIPTLKLPPASPKK